MPTGRGEVLRRLSGVFVLPEVVYTRDLEPEGWDVLSFFIYIKNLLMGQTP